MANPAHPPGLIQRYREELQVRHYARRTVKTYEQWLRRFLRFHQLRHPREMGSKEVNAFLSHLAVAEQVSASTPDALAKNTRIRQGNGPGSGCSPSRSDGTTQSLAPKDDTISIQAWCKKP
jgi:hypothetical protein